MRWGSLKGWVGGCAGRRVGKWKELEFWGGYGRVAVQPPEPQRALRQHLRGCGCAWGMDGRWLRLDLGQRVSQLSWLPYRAWASGSLLGTSQVVLPASSAKSQACCAHLGKSHCDAVPLAALRCAAQTTAPCGRPTLMLCTSRTRRCGLSSWACCHWRSAHRWEFFLCRRIPTRNMEKRAFTPTRNMEERANTPLVRLCVPAKLTLWYGATCHREPHEPRKSPHGVSIPPAALFKPCCALDCMPLQIDATYDDATRLRIRRLQSATSSRAQAIVA